MYHWLVLLHLVGVFGFLLAHGVSVFVVFLVRAEREVAALRALLNLSAATLAVSYVSLLVLLAGGIGATFVGQLWSHGWPWAALGVLVAVWAAMGAQIGPTMRQLRVAVGIPAPGKLGQPSTADEIAAALAHVRPGISATIGGVGLALLLWLMVLKPF
jgi:hypothetical protein